MILRLYYVLAEQRGRAKKPFKALDSIFTSLSISRHAFWKDVDSCSELYENSRKL